MNIFIVSAIVFMALCSNVSPSKSQGMFNRETEFRLRLFLTINHIKSIREHLKEDLNKQYEEFTDDLLEKSRCELNAKRDEIQAFVSRKKNQTGERPIYKECSDNANLKLGTNYETLNENQCAFEDLGILNFATRQMDITIRAGENMLEQYDAALFQCQKNNVANSMSCGDQVIANMTRRVELIKLQEKDANIIDNMMRANFFDFPCIERLTLLFRRHVNTIKARAELCITNKNINVLQYKKSDLLPPDPKDVFDNCSH